jgi:hypothetical protein
MALNICSNRGSVGMYLLYTYLFLYKLEICVLSITPSIYFKDMQFI